MLLSVKAEPPVDGDGTRSSQAAVGEDLRAALAALQRAYGASVGVPLRSEVALLDTADWRLLRAGLTAGYRPRGGLLTVGTGGGDEVEQVIPGHHWPALLSSLPEGPGRDALAGPVGVRALIPVARTRTTTRTVTVRNSDDKIVGRVYWRQITILEPNLPADEAELAPRAEVRAVRGYDRDGERIRVLLASAGVGDASRRGELTDIAARAGLGPADPPPPIRPQQPADVAVAQVLLATLDDIEAAAPGVLADIDTEFLHDLRVDVRRTRSLLKRLGDVLPAGTVERFSPEFKWLGAVSTPTRDLDVYLLGIDELAEMVPHPEDLGAFVEHLEARREVERRALSRALRSERFARLCTDWRTLLTDIIAGDGHPKRADGHPKRTVAQLADERLGAVYDMVARKAKKMDASTPSEKVHDLRKAAKDLRYLLEAFQPLADAERHKLVIKDLKRMQDVLGAFQDGEVQATSLRGYAQEMIDLGETRAEAILAMGELAGRFGAVQLAARSELDAHHAEYLGAATKRRLHRLVKV